MELKNKKGRIIYRIIFLSVCIYGLFLNSGLPQGNFQPKMFMYYTILSNVLCFVFILICLYYDFYYYRWDNAPASFGQSVKPAVTLCIIVTFLIYHFVLAKSDFAMMPGYKPYSLADVLVHYVVPIGMIFDGVLFDEKGLMKRFDPVKWLGLPYVYLIVFMIRGQFGGPITASGSKYPYFFIDIDLLGLNQVLINIVMLTFGFLVLGYCILIVDKVLAKVKR